MSTMPAYTYDAAPQRVLHGPGRAAELGAELARLGARRALLLCSPGQRTLAECLAAPLGAGCAGVIATARVHVPVALAQAAAAQARALQADALVAVGGGSTQGLAKALALELALPVLALPTTYAGSEATAIYGLTDQGHKRTGREARVRPLGVIYDPELSRALPLATSVASALNGMAHAVEALYAPDASPITDALARQGLRLFAQALAGLPAAPQDLALRGRLLSAAWLCGHVLDQTRMGLHHRLCHVLGGRFDLPHAELHALLLPHVVATLAPHMPGPLQALRDTLGQSEPAAALQALADSAGLPRSLQALGVPADALAELARLAADEARSHPLTPDTATVLALLQRAHAGLPAA